MQTPESELDPLNIGVATALGCVTGGVVRGGIRAVGGLRDVISRPGRLADPTDAVPTCRSFGADTHVVLADGGPVPIDDVSVGDEVLSWDLAAGVAVVGLVTETLPHADWLLEAHLSDGSVMSVTEDHRFWSITDNAWVELQDLDVSDVLLSPDGANVTVDWLDWESGVTTDAWDLSVDDEHNFFVAADEDAQPVLVHNQNSFCGLQLPDSISDATASTLQRTQDNLPGVDAAALELSLIHI